MAQDANALRAGVQLRVPTRSMAPLADVAHNQSMPASHTNEPTTDRSIDRPAGTTDPQQIPKPTRKTVLGVAAPEGYSTADQPLADGYRSGESRVSEALRLADLAAGGIDTDGFDLQAPPPERPTTSGDRQHPYCGRIALTEGSLRLNIETNIGLCGYAMGRWHFYSGNSVVDWLLDQPISASSQPEIDAVLRYFQDEYNILWQIRGRRVDFAEYRRDL